MATLKSFIEFRETQLLFATLLIVLSPTASVMAHDDATKIDEIIVTAQRRQVDIQEAAIAVSVLSGEAFDKSNITRLDNFNGYVPGLTIAKNDGAGRVVSIRGVGWETAQNLSTQPSVLMYVDGVYMANPLSMGTDLGDLERIEVFRGPQGTENPRSRRPPWRSARSAAGDRRTGSPPTAAGPDRRGSVDPVARRRCSTPHGCRSAAARRGRPDARSAD